MFGAAVAGADSPLCIQAVQIKRCNRETSPRLLSDVEVAKKDFPRVAKSFGPILSKAEDCWRKLAEQDEAGSWKLIF